MKFKEISQLKSNKFQVYQSHINVYIIDVEL